MSRFAASMDALERDGAMREYRKRAERDPDDLNPAEWIAALHEEHFDVLEQLRAAKQATEGQRLARTTADLQLALQRVKGVQRRLKGEAARLSDVLGDTPAVEALKEIDCDLRAVRAQLEEIVERETS